MDKYPLVLLWWLVLLIPPAITAVLHRNRRARKDPVYWAKGRLVALRPDGARKNFDPGGLHVIRTEEEHREAAEVLTELSERVKRRHGKPDWF